MSVLCNYTSYDGFPNRYAAERFAALELSGHFFLVVGSEFVGQAFKRIDVRQCADY